MKKIKFVASNLLLVMMCIVFAACPEPDSEESLLIGTWTDIDNEGTSYETSRVLTIKSDGTFNYNYYGGGSFGRTGNGYYSYNEDQEMLALTYTSMDRTDLYIVQTLTSKSLVLLDPEDLYAWSFSKQNSGNNKGETNVGTGIVQGHEYVDLGLSVKWATCNVGGNSPEDYGTYFAWGETTTKDQYDWYKYKWGDRIDLTKYCREDALITLEPSDDVATVRWGNKWRMPTEEEMSELCRDCTWKSTKQSGVKGMKVIGPNGNSIFLPAAGHMLSSTLENRGTVGYYWSATLNSSEYSYCLYFFQSRKDASTSSSPGFGSRDIGNTIRPVTE